MRIRIMIDEKFKEYIPLLEGIVNVIKEMGIHIEEMRDRHVKVVLPLAPNLNHIGTMYAGSLFTVGEYLGGPMFVASFDHTKYYPIVKAMSIQYRRPATTDVTVEASLSEAAVEAIQKEADEKGKADWTMDLEVKDKSGQVCCLVQGVWQMRRI
jgi:thioesterase domain-containing protein